MPDKEVMPLITNPWENGGRYYSWARIFQEVQRDADQKWSDDRLEAQKKEWAKNEADWLERIKTDYDTGGCYEKCVAPRDVSCSDCILERLSAHIAELRQEAGEPPGTIGEIYNKFGAV